MATIRMLLLCAAFAAGTCGLLVGCSSEEPAGDPETTETEETATEGAETAPKMPSEEDLPGAEDLPDGEDAEEAASEY